MIISRITDLDLPTGVTHEATDWQISTDLLFSNIIYESMYDTTNLTYKIFDASLDPEVKYYGRARVLLSTGYTEWGNINVFNVKDINDIALDYDFPSLVSIPVITTDSDYMNHAPTLFTITASGYGVVGSGRHIATSWYITDMDDNLIWKSLYDTNNLNSIFFSNKLLLSNRVYRIHTVFHNSSGDSSQTATKTILVNKTDDRVILTTNMYDLDIGIDNYLYIKYIPNITSVRWEIMEIKDGAIDKPLDVTVTTDPITNTFLAANTLLSDKFYLLKLTVIIGTEEPISIYVPFTTFDKVNSVPLFNARLGDVVV